MAGYVTPTTQGASSTITTARLNSYKTGLDYQAINKFHVRARNNAAQSIPNNTRTAITLQAERFDIGSTHGSGSTMTVPSGEAGVVLAGGHLEYAAVNTTGVRQVELFVSASTLIGVQQVPAANVIQDLSVVSLYALAAAATLEMTALQTSGGALNANSSAAYGGEAWMIWEVQ